MHIACLFGLFFVGANADEFKNPAIVCDAGSTGSRVFAFYLLRNGLTHQSYQVRAKSLGKTSVGLSVFAEKGQFREASESLAPLLLQGLRKLGNETPIYILATGGVRSLHNSVKEELLESLKRDLGSCLSEELHTGILALQTLEGTDEALFGLLASNFILGKLPLGDIGKPIPDPFGILDLGGSSLEVSSAGEDGIIGTQDDVLISFKSLGLEKLKQAVLPNKVCEFGTGNGKLCRERIQQVIIADQDLRFSSEKLINGSPTRFVGISAFVYAMDFAFWIMKLKFRSALSSFVLEYPNPSIEAMRDACDVVCSLPLLESLFQQHAFTTSRESSTRCFDVCAISQLIEELFGKVDSFPSIAFLRTSEEGHELEWTLGFYLSTLQNSRFFITDEKQPEEIFHSEL